MKYLKHKDASDFIANVAPLLDLGTCSLIGEDGNVLPWLGLNTTTGLTDPPWDRLCIETTPAFFEVKLCHFDAGSLKEGTQPAFFTINSVRFDDTLFQ